MIPVYEPWEVLQPELGAGSYGKVYEIKRTDSFGFEYHSALKVIHIPVNLDEVDAIRETGMDEKSVTDYFKSVAAEIVKEYDLMYKLRGHTNIVNYEDHVVQAKKDGIGWDIFIRMELLTPLTQYTKQHRLSRRDVIRLGIDICSALERCQKYHIIHRDIKPANIFVSEQGDFKLGDFGIARTLERTTANLSRKRGTLNYMAPEVYQGENYDYSVDLYSLGLVMYRYLNCNRAPFIPAPPQRIKYQDQERAFIRRMSGEQLPSPCMDDTCLAEIILKACSFHPKDRYSSPQKMCDALKALLEKEENTSSDVILLPTVLSELSESLPDIIAEPEWVFENMEEERAREPELAQMPEFAVPTVDEKQTMEETFLMFQRPTAERVKAAREQNDSPQTESLFGADVIKEKMEESETFTSKKVQDPLLFLQTLLPIRNKQSLKRRQNSRNLTKSRHCHQKKVKSF